MIVLGFHTGIALLAVICFSFLENLQPPVQVKDEFMKSTLKPIHAFTDAVKLFRQRKIQLLIVSFLFLGTNQSFFATIYPTAVGFTKQFGIISKSLAGLSGIFTGIGGLTGAFVILLAGKTVNTRVGRYPLVTAGATLLITAYVLVYFNIPDDAPLRETEAVAHFDPPSPTIAMLCAFLLGLGDTLMHTQIYNTLSVVWKTNSAGAFAILHFFKSCAVASQFFVSVLGLIGQLFVLTIFCMLAVISFTFAEKSPAIVVSSQNKN